jgi:hypothetical protein
VVAAFDRRGDVGVVVIVLRFKSFPSLGRLVRYGFSVVNVAWIRKLA